MAGTREIKLRIKSIKETQQMTKAMNLVAASKLRKARQQLDKAMPFFHRVETTIADILMHSSIDDKAANEEQTPSDRLTSIYFDERPDKKDKSAGIIILSGDKGLAGAYNHNIIRFAENFIDSVVNPRLFVAGNIGRSYFIRKKLNVDENFLYPVQNPTVYRARDIADFVVDLFKKRELDEVYIIYTEMVSSVKMEPKLLKLLPLNLDTLKQEIGYEYKEMKPDDTIRYEPSPVAVFNVLIPKYVKGLVYGALVEAFASEHNARMTAMDDAMANADEMLRMLRLNYNRARQAAITQEISEIVGGASAMQ